MANHLMDLHMATESNRMNEIMEVLTIIATIFILLTFVGGVYSMNFEYVPDLSYWCSYGAVWGVLILTASALVVPFSVEAGSD